MGNGCGQAEELTVADGFEDLHGDFLRALWFEVCYSQPDSTF